MEDYTDHALEMQDYDDNFRRRVRWVLTMADLQKPNGKTPDQKRDANWKYLTMINEMEKKHWESDCVIDFDKIREDLPFPEVA